MKVGLIYGGGRYQQRSNESCKSLNILNHTLYTPDTPLSEKKCSPSLGNLSSLTVLTYNDNFNLRLMLVLKYCKTTNITSDVLFQDVVCALLSIDNITIYDCSMRSTV